MIKSQIQEKDVLEALRQVIDPELGCSIVDLGLIYQTIIEGAKIHVKMTLTSAGCPMQATLSSGVEQALLALEGVKEVGIELVWEPPWSPARMTDEGRALLGVQH